MRFDDVIIDEEDDKVKIEWCQSKWSFPWFGDVTQLVFRCLLDVFNFKLVLEVAMSDNIELLRMNFIIKKE